MRHIVQFWKRAFNAISRGIVRFADGPYADDIVRPKA